MTDTERARVMLEILMDDVQCYVDPRDKSTRAFVLSNTLLYKVLVALCADEHGLEEMIIITPDRLRAVLARDEAPRALRRAIPDFTASPVATTTPLLLRRIETKVDGLARELAELKAAVELAPPSQPDGGAVFRSARGISTAWRPSENSITPWRARWPRSAGEKSRRRRRDFSPCTTRRTD